REVAVPHKTCEAGEPNRRDPVEDKGAPDHGTVGGNDGGDTGLHNYLNETATDSTTGEASARDGIHDTRPLHRSGLAARGVPTHAQGWCAGRGWSNRGRVCSEPGGQPPDATRTREGRHIPSTAGATGSHPEGK